MNTILTKTLQSNLELIEKHAFDSFKLIVFYNPGGHILTIFPQGEGGGGIILKFGKEK